MTSRARQIEWRGKKPGNLCSKTVKTGIPVKTGKLATLCKAEGLSRYICSGITVQTKQQESKYWYMVVVMVLKEIGICCVHPGLCLMLTRNPGWAWIFSTSGYDKDTFICQDVFWLTTEHQGRPWPQTTMVKNIWCHSTKHGPKLCTT